MNLPDLVRPTQWRLHLRLWWGSTSPCVVQGVWPEDALEAGMALGLKPGRVCRMEFQDLETGLWKELNDRDRHAAIVLANTEAAEEEQ